MTQMPIIDFANFRLWCLVGTDIAAAAGAIQQGEVDGIYISEHRGYKFLNLDCLSQFNKLKILAVGDAPNVDISAVSQLVNLEFLSISEGKGLMSLEMLVCLKHLRLAMAPGLQLPGAGLPELRQLAVWNYLGGDLSMLSNYPSLMHLEMTQAPRLVSLNGIENIAGMSILELAYCPKLNDLQALSSLHGLHKLKLKNTKSVDGYSVIRTLKALNGIVIENGAILPSIEFLAGLECLESVVLRKTIIHDNDLSPLMLLPALTHVYLDNKKKYGSAVKDIEKLAADRKRKN